MEDIHFTIITTTYNREELIMRTINSVLDQTYTNWDMIIVKDNPNLSYKNVKDYIKNKSNITFLENKKNLGNNGSKNIALDNISNKANFVVYLDDDDWLDKGALSQAKIIISENPEIGWFVSNRSLKNNKPITKNLKRKEKINYITDVLILKRFIGDATHFIDIKKWGGG
jgi:teichuronic acid biosynthesis glycosyltransferase TuaG